MSQAIRETLDPHGSPLAGMLGQINVLEHDGDRPLLSAIVLAKVGKRPGIGFWNISRDMGINVDDAEQFWVKSLNDCFDYWSKRTP